MLYKHASKIIDQIQKKQGTIKSLIHSSGYKNLKQLYALVCETLKYSSIIDKILVTTKFLELEKWLDRPMATILVYEALFGRGIQCGGKHRLAIKRHKSSLNAALVRMKIKMGVVNNKDLLPDSVKDEVILPRYVRVNTLKISIEDAINQFVKEGFKCVLTQQEAVTVSKDAENAQSLSTMFRDLVNSLKKSQFMCDVHVQHILVFPPGTDFHKHQLYLTGAIILQDKASCLPAYILAPPPGSHVIDACAAPGNKTSHLAAILENTGRVFAFELDPKRLSLMSRLTKPTGATNLDLTNHDFLKVNPTDEKFRNVNYILLDPSCSGSGIVSRLNHLTNDDQSESQDRLESLARVQTALLSHALSFPNVKRVVYSTCSVHRRENEEVVKEVLDSHPEFQLECALPAWKNRGIGDKDHTDDWKNPSDMKLFDFQACLRAVPKEDITIGFFVALFERKDISIRTKESPCVPTSQNGKLSKVGQRKKRRNKHKSVEIKKEIISMDSSENQSKNNSPLETGISKRKSRKRRKKTQGESDSKKQKIDNIKKLDEHKTKQETEEAINENANKVTKMKKAKRNRRQKTAAIS
ncbi:probable 28S rRNA (cytosine-C(5))-methyltransferase [Asterias rubens]|uniref:probable 28S rRNA (cytosine-C(5))-methyltransferase n=1 Tax=Asterias rubens TaxID=7604 RepID=UPI00145562D9|nr:probable 28S rRNA (cytosine-C(5))-methyltransferase [Asterias rubens]